jgi:hypothetical protein
MAGTITLLDSLISSSTSTGSYITSTDLDISGYQAVIVDVLAPACANGAPVCELDNFDEGIGPIAMTFVQQAFKNSSADRMYRFVRRGFFAATRHVRFQSATDAPSGLIILMYGVTSEIFYASDADILRQISSSSNRAAASTPADTFDIAPLADNPILGFVGNASFPTGITPPTSFTEIFDSGNASPVTKGAEAARRNSGHTSSTVTWGSLSPTAHGVMIAEVNTIAPRTATMASTLDEAKAEQDGTVAMSGPMSSTLGSVSADQDGQVIAPITGTQVTGLGGISTTPFIAEEIMSGAMNSQLGGVFNGMDGNVINPVSGPMASTLDSVGADMDAEVVQPVDGIQDVTLGAITTEMHGEESIEGQQDANLNSLSSDMHAQEEMSGPMNSALGEVTGTMSGVMDAEGTMASTLGPVTSVMEGVEEISGPMASTLGSVESSMAGGVAWEWTFQAAFVGAILRAINGNDGNVPLWWTIAESSGVVRQELRRSTTSFPTSPTDGDLVFEDDGTARYYLDEFVTNGVTYYYTMFVVVDVEDGDPIYVPYEAQASDDGTPRHIPLFLETREEYVPARGELGAVVFPLPVASSQVWGELTSSGRDDRDVVAATLGTRVVFPVSGVIASIEVLPSGLRAVVIDTAQGGFRFILGGVLPLKHVVAGRRVRAGETMGHVGGPEMELSIVKLPVGRYGHRTVRPSFLFLTPEDRDGRRRG